MTPSISIVIPTWCEAAGVAEAVACAVAVGDEVIVVDAGSPDGTGAAARAAGARVVVAPRGRGAQLDAGVRAARGQVLLFLHADVRLPAEAREAIIEALSDPEVLGGNFHLRFEPCRGWARFFTWANHVRRRLMRIYYGDSAIFVRRWVYEDIGGFRPIAVMEDYDLVRRLERRGRTVYVRTVSVRASARRFARAPVRTMLVWGTVQLLYMVGVAPRRLAALYADIR